MIYTLEGQPPPAQGFASYWNNSTEMSESRIGFGGIFFLLLLLVAAALHPCSQTHQLKWGRDHTLAGPEQ